MSAIDDERADLSADYPPHVTDAWAAWQRVNTSVRVLDWDRMGAPQQAAWAAVIEVAVKGALAELKAEPPAQFAVVEAMGHRTLVGAISDATVAGKAMLRLARLDGQGEHYVAPGSLYMVTPCSQAQARAAQSRLWGGLPSTVLAAIGDGKPDGGDGDSPDHWAGDDEEDAL